MVVIGCPVGTVADLQSDSILFDGYFGRDPLGVCGGAQLWLENWYHWGCQWTSVKIHVDWKREVSISGSYVFFLCLTVSTRFFHQLVELGQYSTWGVAPLRPVNRHGSDPFVELAFSSQALHPTHETHSWPLQALSHRLRSSQQRPPSLFLSLWNIHPLAMIWRRLWTPGLPFRTLSYKVRLKPDNQRLKPETSLQPDLIFCCDLVRHPAVRGGFHWVFDDIGGRNSDVGRVCRSELQNPNRIHWFPTQLFEENLKPGRGILYQNPKRGRSLLVCHGPGKHCIRHASRGLCGAHGGWGLMSLRLHSCTSILGGFLGGMGGNAMIGLSTINVLNGGRGRMAPSLGNLGSTRKWTALQSVFCWCLLRVIGITVINFTT